MKKDYRHIAYAEIRNALIDMKYPQKSALILGLSSEIEVKNPYSNYKWGVSFHRAFEYGRWLKDKYNFGVIQQALW